MSTVKHIDTNGLLYYSTLIRQALAGKMNVGDGDLNTIENIKIEGESSNVSISSKVATIPLATTSASGAMSDTDKTKLNGIESGAQVNVIESIKLQGASSDLAISSKKVTIPVDTTPTSSSGNPISSGAVYTLNNTLTNLIEDKFVYINYVYPGEPLSPSEGDFWHDTTNDVLKIYKNSSWSNYVTSDRSFVIGIIPDNREGAAPEIVIFSYNAGSFSVADMDSVDSKAPKASPALTGTPTAPTATAGTNTTQIATTAFVQTAIGAAVSGSFKFVNSLPSTGEEGYIYLVPHTHSGSSTNTNPDVKDEYIWNTSANPAQWELIGNTDLDLSNYWNKTDLVTATNAEVLACWEDSASS